MSDQSIEATSATQRDDTTAFAAQVEGMSVNSGSLISLFHTVGCLRRFGGGGIKQTLLRRARLVEFRLIVIQRSIAL